MPVRLHDPGELDGAIAAHELGARLRGEPRWLAHACARGGRGTIDRRSMRGGGGPPRTPYLIDYNDATFTRASEAAAVDPREGWAWYDLATPWPGVDVPRILSDGAILVEGARTNLHLQNQAWDSVAWNAGGSSGSISANVGNAPDGSATADRVNFTANANDQWRQTIAASGVPDASTVQLSSYLRREAAGADAIRWLFRAKDGATVSVPALTLTGEDEWTRYEASFAALTGTTGLLSGLINNTDASARSFLGSLFQFEVGAFASSPIRTAGAAATRAIEKPSFFGAGAWPEAINSGRWTVDVWPGWASTQLPASALAYMLAQANTDVLYFFQNAGTLEVRLIGTSAPLITPQALTFSTHQKLTITVDWPAQQLTIAGATTGNGTIAISASSWGMDPATERLAIGHSASTAGRELYGVISRPRRA